MNKTEHNIQLSEQRSPWASIFFLLLFLLAGFFVAQFIGFLFILPFFDFDLEAISQVLSDPLGKEEWRIAIILLQGVTAFLAFILTPWLYLRLMEHRSVSSLFDRRAAHLTPLMLTVFSVIAFMFVNSVFIEWNQEFKFPDFMHEFEQWAQAQELSRQQLTEALTKFDNFSEFLLGLLVMAVIPAVGEELLFRGLLQNQMQKLSGNIHIAIWVTALIFSLIHVQFYGLVPRMMLGALFGYLYFWSGSLLIPILAHFVNNGLTLVLLYLYQKDFIAYDVESAESLSWPVLTLFVAAGTVFLWSFKRFFDRIEARKV